MVVTNFSKNKYTLDAVEARADTARFTFSSSAFADMIIPLGAARSRHRRSCKLLFRCPCTTMGGHYLVPSHGRLAGERHADTGIATFLRMPEQLLTAKAVS
jgi:hypothetical protein